jgi:hypothetical protein
LAAGGLDWVEFTLGFLVAGFGPVVEVASAHIYCDIVKHLQPPIILRDQFQYFPVIVES